MDSQRTEQCVTEQSIAAPAETSHCIDWYAEGEERIVEVGGSRVVIRYVGRKGRRGRIAITAPPGAAFRTRG